MKLHYLAGCVMILSAVALAEDIADRGKLSGKWQAPEGAGESWILDGKPDAVHITEFQNGQKLAEFECNTLGRECETRDAGHHAKVSFWFNGAKLVELETRGSEVVKRRFSVGEQPDLMELETIPIVPPGKPTLEHFKRVDVSAASK